MQREVVDLAEVRSGTDDVCAMDKEIGAQYLDKTRYVLGSVAGGDLRIKLSRNGLPRRLLEDGDNLRRLFRPLADFGGANRLDLL